jgi:hypothetical protein
MGQQIFTGRWKLADSALTRSIARSDDSAGAHFFPRVNLRRPWMTSASTSTPR